MHCKVFPFLGALEAFCASLGERIWLHGLSLAQPRFLGSMMIAKSMQEPTQSQCPAHPLAVDGVLMSVCPLQVVDQSCGSVELLGLEGTHMNHYIQLLAPYRTT